MGFSWLFPDQVLPDCKTARYKWGFTELKTPDISRFSCQVGFCWRVNLTRATTKGVNDKLCKVNAMREGSIYVWY